MCGFGRVGFRGGCFGGPRFHHRPNFHHHHHHSGRHAFWNGFAGGMMANLGMGLLNRFFPSLGGIYNGGYGLAMNSGYGFGLNQGYGLGLNQGYGIGYQNGLIDGSFIGGLY